MSWKVRAEGERRTLLFSLLNFAKTCNIKAREAHGGIADYADYRAGFERILREFGVIR